MRILYLCHRIPYPPNKGEKIRAFHQLRALAEVHEVDLFTLADDPADLAEAGALGGYCRELRIVPLDRRWARLRALPYLATPHTPLTVPYFAQAELAGAVREALERRSYDRVFVYSSAMAQYVRPGGPPAVMDFVDIDSDKWRQYATFASFPYSWVYRREARCLRRFEREACGKAAAVIVTTEREAELGREIAPGTPVHVVPNGVDLDFFRPGPPEGADSPAIVFVGDMSYFPNQEAVGFYAREVLPAVRRAVADARFLIVGRNPNRDVLRLAELPGVEVTGSVPDVRPYLYRARVAIAPFRIAAGIQNKVLEAMACELPLIATRRAVQGLEPSVRELVDTGDTAEALAAATVARLSDAAAARERGRESRRRVEAVYAWPQALGKLLNILELRESLLNPVPVRISS